MDFNFESALKSNLDHYMDDVYTSIPAMVVGIQQIQDGLVDVQPLVNKVYKDGSKDECPVLYGVPIIMPCTTTSSITMPVNQGDTVYLMFSQRDIDVFKNGGDSPHDPASFRSFNMNDAVAIIGLNPVNKSKLSAKSHSIPFDNTSLIMSHNVGTEKESYIKISQEGSISIEAKNDLNFKAKSVNIKCNAVSMEASTFDVKAVVTIDGMNLNNFMKSHVHGYTDDGNPMLTDIPEGF